MRRIFVFVMSLLLVFLTQIYALFIVPPVRWPGPKGEILGIVQKIFYLHVPLAWVGFLMVLVSALIGLLYLSKRNLKWDKLSASAMEVGTLFLGLAVFSGSLWARPAWGTFWTWDPRLVTMTVLLILAISYMFLRGIVDEPDLRARISALLSIIVAVNIPVVFLSIKLFRTLHPAVIKGLSQGDSYGMDAPVLTGLLLNLTSMTILGLVLFYLRYGKEEK